MHRTFLLAVTGLLLVGWFLVTPLHGQDNAANNDTPVSRQEFEQWKKEMAELKKDNAELKKDNAELKKDVSTMKKQQAEQASAAEDDAKDYDKHLKDLDQEVKKIKPGGDGLVIAGDMNVGYVAQHGNPSSFFADMSPLILWQPTDSHFLVETAFDLGIAGADINSQTTTVTLNLADISYEVCDNFMVGGGLFAVPFGQYHNHFDPPWVNKLPDDPLAFDAIAPISEVGFYAKGAIPSGTTRWTYDVYVANGPNLDTTNSGSLGTLNFNDYTDLNNNKAVGGRIGFLPLNDMEMGYSVQFSEPSPAGFQNVHVFMQAADFHYKPVIKALCGQFDLAAEWIWSDQSRATYMPASAAAMTFANYSQGGYVSLAYRPTLVDSKFIRNLEIIGRFDSLQTSLNTPSGEHEMRWTIGLDYWVTPYCVLKTAYEFDRKKVAQSQNAFICQLGFGL